jgi:hypothetical protein
MCPFLFQGNEAKMNKFNHSEIVSGSPKTRRGTVEQVGDFPDLFGQAPQEVYYSAYRFSEDFAAYTAERGTVSGYTGPCRSVGLHFDFDGPTAFNDVNKFTEKMCMTPSYECNIDNMQFYFSGNKGFHVWICTPETMSLPAGVDVPEMVKKTCVSLAGEYLSFDRAVYDKTRIFRAINSRHPASGLFKIPLYAAEFWVAVLDEIKMLAKNQRCLSDKLTIKKYMREHTEYGDI